MLCLTCKEEIPKHKNTGIGKAGNTEEETPFQNKLQNPVSISGMLEGDIKLSYNPKESYF